MTVHYFISLIFFLCRIYDMSVTSWGRTEQRNQVVGGVPNSWHLRFLAVDVVPDDFGVSDDLVAACEALDLEVIVEQDHWHIEPKGAPPPVSTA